MDVQHLSQICLLLWVQKSTDSVVYVSVGDTVEIACPFRSTTVAWFRGSNFTPISEGKTLNEMNGDHRYSITENYSTGEYNLKITRLQLTDVGHYICIVVIGKRPQQYSQEIVLKFPPTDMDIVDIVNNKSIINVAVHGTEGDNIHLICVVKSGIPKENLTWIHNEIILKQGDSGSLEINITLIHTLNLGMYSCKAISIALQKPLLGTVSFHVYYKPKISINANKTMKIVEGDTMTIRCNVDSNPQATLVKWLKSVNSSLTVMSSGHFILDISVVTRRDSGIYICTATNNIGSGEADTNVIIFYAPDIVIYYENYTTSSITQTLKCDPRGVPAAYTYYHWEHKSYYGDHIRYLVGSNDSILHLTGGNKYQENGFYTCTATNCVADIKGCSNKTATVYLSVTGKPVFVAQQDYVFYGILQEPVELAVNIFSNPKYTNIVVRKENGGTLVSDEMDVRYTEEIISMKDNFFNLYVRVKGYKITVRISKLRQEYLQNYTFITENEFGSNYMGVSLFLADTPKSPLNFSVFLVGQQHTVIVSWVRNFNGGFKQTFFAEYRLHSLSEWKIVRCLNFSDEDPLSWKIDNLIADQIYYFRMYSENKLGQSNRTMEIAVLIHNESCTLDLTLKVVIPVVATVVCAVMLALIRVYTVNKKSSVETRLENITDGHYDEVEEPREMNEVIERHNWTVSDADSSNSDTTVSSNKDENVFEGTDSNSDKTTNNDTYPKETQLNTYEQLTENCLQQSERDTAYKEIQQTSEPNIEAVIRSDESNTCHTSVST